jgi:sterol desaturase/sphingolipid hydroxylase (fatty acid hydroxylase superfamily)
VLFSSAAKLGFVTLLGIPPAGLLVFEVVMLACAQFQHANIRIPARLEPILWRTLVPPAMHRLYHAANRRDPTRTSGRF